MSTKRLAIAGILIGALLVGLSLALSQQSAPSPDIPGLLWPEPPQIKPFTLTKTNGEVFNESDLGWALDNGIFRLHALP